ncbi:hypothetical protein Pelo_11048 [Pelomyxa schiedti]|nr:hypothetical protein Pelo_11048 [Pelomyxa schiedti]
MTEAKLREAFDLWDKNHDGFIQLDEIRAALTHAGASADRVVTMADEVLRTMDTNHDGQISWEEFKTGALNFLKD